MHVVGCLGDRLLQQRARALASPLRAFICAAQA
jgi:hypothetical protein